jgi:hypothetical protein
LTPDACCSPPLYRCAGNLPRTARADLTAAASTTKMRCSATGEVVRVVFAAGEHHQHQLAIALPRSVPPALQRRDFLVATDKWREMALARTASTTARPHKPEQRYRPWHAYQLMAAALLNYEQAGDLALNPCSNQDCAGFGQRLHSCCNIRRIQIDSNWAMVQST